MAEQPAGRRTSRNVLERRVAQLQAENDRLRAEVDALGSAWETWAPVIAEVRERIARALARKGGAA